MQILYTLSSLIINITEEIDPKRDKTEDLHLYQVRRVSMGKKKKSAMTQAFRLSFLLGENVSTDPFIKREAPRSYPCTSSLKNNLSVLHIPSLPH